jgi:GntR family transcriptional regulator / MocR family aminotransferase
LKRCAGDSLREFHVERESADPMHRQLYDFLRRALADGQLSAGTQLPSTRAMARKLGVSRNTVLNAYETLTMEGLLTGQVGSGTRVRRLSDPIAQMPYPRTLNPRRILRESHYPVDAQTFCDPDGNVILIHR